MKTVGAQSMGNLRELRGPWGAWRLRNWRRASRVHHRRVRCARAEATLVRIHVDDTRMTHVT